MLHGFEMGGAQLRTLAFAGELARRGRNVALLVVQDVGPLRAEVPAGVHVEELAAVLSCLPWLGSRRRHRVRMAVPALALYLRRHRPQVLIAAANHVLLAAIQAHGLAGRTDVKLVLRVSNHLSGPSLSRRMRAAAVRASFDRADAVMPVAQVVARDLERVHPRLTSLVRVVPNPVLPRNLDRLISEPVRHPWYADNGPPVVLSVGRLAPQKDFPTLLRAFARFSRHRPARLLILGEGSERPRLEALVQELGLGGKVDLPGAVGNPLPFMRAAALFVSSSAWEGMPGALIEAMACGCPVAATDCSGGSAEILEGGRLGPLAPVGDTEVLAAAMRDALNAPREAVQLRARAADFSVEAAADALLDLLRDL